MPACTFIRVLKAADKATALAEAVASLRQGLPQPGILFQVDPAAFRSVPTAPFAYWVSDRVRQLFVELPPFESEGRTARVGLQTSDDFRFVRAWWEVLPERTVRGTAATTPEQFREQTREGRPWVPFAKGGAYSPYYADLHLVVNWGDDGAEIRNFVDENGNAIQASEHRLFLPAGVDVAAARTTSGISFRAMPSGVIFADKGPALFSADPLGLLAVTQSEVFEGLCALQLGAADAAARSYEVGLVSCPVPFSLPPALAYAAREQIEAARKAIHSEVAHVFTGPLIVNSLSHTQRQLFDREAAARLACNIQLHIDQQVAEAYGLEDADVEALRTAIGARAIDASSEDDEDAPSDADTSVESPAERLSYLLGACFGRWDIRYATGEREAPELPDPFDPLPVCSPGMLQGPDGLPAKPADLPQGYPVAVAWSGILVDDEGHGDDIVRRTRAAMEVIWVDRAADIEEEMCRELGCASLRDYLRSPQGFFDTHLKQYSKSRRKAPIYWPLSSATGTYTLWLYYPRLTDQTLYLCINDYVDPRLQRLQEEIEHLRSRTKRSAGDERELDRLVDVQGELEAFRSELLRVAAFWKPHHDDGVQITAAPLYRLFRHRGWQKVLSDTWEALQRGDYDWSYLAYSVWPERVTTKCRSDKSLAIAHGLEHLYSEPKQQPKRRSRRGK